MAEYNQIQFPDEIKVRAPETDHAISGLSSAFASLSHMLQDSFKEIASSLRALRQLPEMLTTFQQTMVREFSQLYVSEIENQIFCRHANLHVAEQKLQASTNLEKAKLEQLQPDSHRLAERYQQLLENVGGECLSRVNRMDSHAFQILDKIYPKEVQERFSSESSEALRYLTEHAGLAAVNRSEQLNKGLMEAQSALQDFLSQRHQFYGQLDAFLRPMDMKPGCYEVPVLYLEIRDTTTGIRQIEVMMLDNNDQAVAVPEQCTSWVESMVQRQLANCSRKPLNTDERRKLGDLLENTMNVSSAERRRFESVSIDYMTIEGGCQ
jgi:hypothetical protein